MDTLLQIFHVIKDIFEIPAIVLGVVALLGLLLQKKSASDVIKGTTKAILGLLILGVGSGAIVNALIPFADMFSFAFKLDGVVPFDEAVVGAVIDAVTDVAICTSVIMVCGFIVNLVLARITPFKYIFLTGHMIWISAGCISWALFDSGLSIPYIIVFGSIIQGMISVILPAIAQPIMRKLTGGDKIAYSHLTTLGVVGSAYVGKLVGKPEKSAEDLNLPEGLNFFRDVAVSVSIVMFIIYLVTALACGPAYEGNPYGGQNYIIFSFLQALGFAAGVLVLLQGVRMFISEIIPAFRGIAVKLIPGVIPALDCPATFQYGPTSLMIGFIFSVIGMLIGMLICFPLGLIIPLPSVIGGFFTGGTSGIFGNAIGGRRGAMVAGFVYGLFLTIPVALFYPLFDLAKHGISGLAMLCPDALAIMALIKLAFATQPIVVFVIAIGLFVFASFMFAKKKKSTDVESSK